MSEENQVEETKENQEPQDTNVVGNDGKPMTLTDIENAISEKEGKEEQPAERPEWLPEKFKTPEDLAKSYSELEKTLKEKGKVAPEEYELPEDVDLNVDDDVFKGFIDVAKDANLSNEQLSSVLRYAQESGILDNPDYDEEMKKLGKDKDDILNGLTNYATSKLSEQEAETLSSMVYTAEQAKLLNKIIRSNTSATVPAKLDTAATSVDTLQSQLDEMLSDAKIKSDHMKQAKAAELAAKLAEAKRG